MIDLADPASASASGRVSPLLLTPLARRHFEPLLETTEASQFHEMETGFAASGGMRGGEELTNMLRRDTDQPVSVLARWIVDQAILAIEWHSQMWIPVFQFHPVTLAPRPVVGDVIRELGPVLGDWEVALWFARTNVWLHAAPADVIAFEPRAVFEAARGERFLARG